MGAPLIDATAPGRPRPIQAVRVDAQRIAAPRALVYEAWTRLDHRRQWFIFWRR